MSVSLGNSKQTLKGILEQRVVILSLKKLMKELARMEEETAFGSEETLVRLSMVFNVDHNFLQLFLFEATRLRK